MSNKSTGKLAHWSVYVLGLSIGVLLEMQFAVSQSLSYETVMLFSIVVGTVYLAMVLYDYWDARVQKSESLTAV